MALGRAQLSGDLSIVSMLQTTAGRLAGLVGRESWLIKRMRPAYESLLEWSGRGRGAAWTINGVEYRVDPHHRHRLGRDYDAPVAAFLRERVKPGALCVDVGANVGVYVLQFAHWSAPAGRVVAFEPNPGAHAVLDKGERDRRARARRAVTHRSAIWRSACQRRRHDSGGTG